LVWNIWNRRLIGQLRNIKSSACNEQKNF
jgi:hypothetical protein